MYKDLSAFVFSKQFVTAMMADSAPNVELHTSNDVLENSIGPAYAVSTQTITGPEPKAKSVGLPTFCFLPWGVQLNFPIRTNGNRSLRRSVSRQSRESPQ
jgi:hypothetical protein